MSGSNQETQETQVNHAKLALRAEGRRLASEAHFDLRLLAENMDEEVAFGFWDSMRDLIQGELPLLMAPVPTVSAPTVSTARVINNDISLVPMSACEALELEDRRVTFGKHKGSRFGDVPLKYWDWFVGTMNEDRQNNKPSDPRKVAAARYLLRDDIKRRLQEEIGE